MCVEDRFDYNICASVSEPVVTVTYDIVLIVLLKGCASSKLFNNLISNALMYSENSTLIAVHVSMCTHFEHWKEYEHCDNPRVVVSPHHFRIERLCGSILTSIMDTFDFAMKMPNITSTIKYVTIQYTDMWWIRTGWEETVRRKETYLEIPCFPHHVTDAKLLEVLHCVTGSKLDTSLVEYQEGSFYSVTFMKKMSQDIQECTKKLGILLAETHETVHQVSAEEILLPTAAAIVLNITCPIGVVLGRDKTFLEKVHRSNQLTLRYGIGHRAQVDLHHSMVDREQISERYFAIKAAQAYYVHGYKDTEYEMPPDDTLNSNDISGVSGVSGVSGTISIITIMTATILFLGCVGWFRHRSKTRYFRRLDKIKGDATHVSIFLLLTFIHALSLLLYRMSEKNGRYEYSIASVVLITETCKLGLASGLYVHEQKSVWNVRRIFSMQLKVALQTIVLSAMYTFNNFLSFYAVHFTDPGTLAMGKSMVPYICAFFALCLNLEHIPRVHWYTFFFQCMGLLMTQISVGNKASYGLGAYLLLGSAVLITAFSSVFNNKIIKTSGESQHAINIIMYTSGIGFSTVRLFTYDKPTNIFHGYNGFVILLIFVMSVYGICISYAYKLSNVFVKNLSSSAAVCVVLAVGVISGYNTMTINLVVGACTVVAATLLYFQTQVNSTAIETNTELPQIKSPENRS